MSVPCPAPTPTGSLAGCAPPPGSPPHLPLPLHFPSCPHSCPSVTDLGHHPNPEPCTPINSTRKLPHIPPCVRASSPRARQDVGHTSTHLCPKVALSAPASHGAGPAQGAHVVSCFMTLLCVVGLDSGEGSTFLCVMFSTITLVGGTTLHPGPHLPALRQGSHLTGTAC